MTEFFARLLGLTEQADNETRLELQAREEMIRRHGKHVIILAGEQEEIADNFLPSYRAKEASSTSARRA